MILRVTLNDAVATSGTRSLEGEAVDRGSPAPAPRNVGVVSYII